MFTIAQPPVFIGKCLDLRYDGFGRFPPLPSSLDFRTPGDQFLDETLEIDPIVTWRHGDCGIRARGATNLLRAAGTQRGEAYDGERKGREDPRRNMKR
jgi:hypothetical protein